jgi:hypothetical protein
MRLSDSFADGTLELIEETDASCVVLGWSGPRVGVDSFFGNEIDGVGSDSTVPTVAAHLTRPWDRVVVVPGTSEMRWHSQDARLALIVAGRLCGRKDIPLLVIANDHALVEEHIGPRTGYEFLAAQVPGDTLVEVLRPGDLVVAPSYLLPEMPIARRIRLSNRLADQNLAIVAGPGRLAVAPASTPYATEQILGPQI